MISGNTRVFAVIGSPVGHSLSPVMHNAAFRVLGIDAVFIALDLGDQDVAPVIAALVGAGGGGSITRPHKTRAAAAVERPSERVRVLGACNTFWAEEGKSAGDNTDVAGVLYALDRVAPTATTWAVAGTGAGARAAVEAARERGARVAVRSRDPERAREFDGWMRGRGVAPAEVGEAELLLNATPLGMEDGDPLPFQGDVAPGAAAIDMVYRSGGTPWVRRVRAAGGRAVDGREMLVGQGAAAFRRWFPAAPPPIEVMCAAVEDALRPGR